jgi:hypothetical protein
MVWNCDWAQPSASVPTGSVSDRARAFRPRVARTSATAVHHRAVGFRPPLVTMSPCMRRTAHVRCAVGLIPSRHGFIVRCATAEYTAAPLRSVTPHPKPATALPADPSTGTIDLSSGSPPPELPRAPPRAPLPLVFLQPSHHPTRSPPTHHPSTTHQQSPSTCGPRYRRRACPPDRRRREQPDSSEDSHF